MALIGALAVIGGGDAAPDAIARAAYSIETDDLAQQSGVQDQLAAAHGGISLITIADLSFMAQEMNQTTMKTIDIFSLVLLIYLAISLTITIVMRLLEQAASRGLARGRAS